MTITNDNGGQANTQVEVDAGEIDQDTEHLNDEITDDADDDADDDQDDDDQAGGRRNREIGYRRRAQAAEAARDQATELVNRQRQAIIDREVTAARLTERQVAVAGITVEAMLDDETGLIDSERLSEAISGAVREFGIRTGRPPAPNMQQGAHGVTAKTGGVADVIRGALGR